MLTEYIHKTRLLYDYNTMDAVQRRKILAQLMLFMFGKTKTTTVQPQTQCIDYKPNNIIILGQERFGDSILLTPLIRRLREELPDCHIHYVVSNNRSYSFFKDDTNITLYHAKQNFWQTILTLRQIQADIVFNPKDTLSFTQVFLSHLVKAKKKVGIYVDEQKQHYDYLVEKEWITPTIEKNCALLDVLGISYAPENLRPYIPEAPISPIIHDTITYLQNLKSQQTILAVNLSAGSHIREWNKEHWLELLSLIQQPTLVFALGDKQADREFLATKLPHIVIPSPATANFAEAAALLQCCSMLISPDTAMVHLASALQLPVIDLSLYYVGIERFLPYHTQNRVLFTTTILDDIHPQDVFQQYKELLNDIKK
jgi:heptosyltransferase-3